MSDRTTRGTDAVVVDAGHPGRRWVMLALLCIGFVACSLNWFNVSSAFGQISVTFGVGLGPLSALISLFIVTYAAFHIPGGVLATRFGIVKVLVAGLLVESLGGILSGLSVNFATLATARLVAGLGASVFVAVGFAAAMIWFEPDRTTLALGICGAAFGVGASIGVDIWTGVQTAIGWRSGLVFAGILGLAAAGGLAIFFRTPGHLAVLRGVSFDRASLASTLRNRQMWIYSVSIIGGYGAYFTAAQLLARYGVNERGLTEPQGALLASAITLGGFPASILGGYIADRTTSIRTVIVASLAASGIALTMLPVAPDAALWPIAFCLGFFVIFGFTAWSAVPSKIGMVSHEHIATATGLMLTIAGIGGIVIPIGFAATVQHLSFPIAWILLGGLTIILAMTGLAARNRPQARDQERYGVCQPRDGAPTMSRQQLSKNSRD